MSSGDALVVIDGSRGEGGGQIVRSSCALSLLTGRPFRIENVRARRKTPGLARQHMTAVLAAARIGSAEVHGATVGSGVVAFRPGPVTPGRWVFPIGTAGSTTLVLQTVLMPLLAAGGPSTVVIEGGTHNVKAPPFEFLARTYLPLVERITGGRVHLELERAGFYPAGGGKIVARIEPAASPPPRGRFELLERGAITRRVAEANVWRLPVGIARRELAVVEDTLGWRGADLVARERSDGFGPGNALSIQVDAEHVQETFTGIGERGVPAERVAEGAAREAKEWLDAGVPVGEHLADQLLLPRALGGGGVFRTVRPTPHTTTHAEILAAFLDARVDVEDEDAARFRVSVSAASAR